jgi:hypothetical protein
LTPALLNTILEALRNYKKYVYNLSAQKKKKKKGPRISGSPEQKKREKDFKEEKG